VISVPRIKQRDLTSPAQEKEKKFFRMPRLLHKVANLPATISPLAPSFALMYASVQIESKKL